MTIASILLVPSAEHREALLGDGPCGSSPPRMWQCPGIPWGARLPVWGGPFTNALESEWALVLAHDGKVVREGRDRAAYVLACRETDTIIGDDFPPTMIAHHADDDLWMLHADGVEVEYTPAERPTKGVCVDGLHTFDYAGDDAVSVLGLREGLAEVPSDLRLAAGLALICAARGLGRIVLLDHDGREVSP